MNRLIAISGENGSGKDLVGYIINQLLKDAYEIQKFANCPIRAYKTITGIDFSSLKREDKELHRHQFIRFCESIKGVLGQEIYSKKLFQEYTTHCRWIITDLRFSYEEKEIKDRDGYVFHVTKDGSLNPNLSDPDTIIVNNGSVKDLFENVRSVLIENNLI